MSSNNISSITSPILKFTRKSKQQDTILPRTSQHKHKKLRNPKMKLINLIFIFFLATLSTALPVALSSQISRSRARLSAIRRLRQDISTTSNPNAEDEMFVPRKISLTAWPSLRQLRSLGLSNLELLKPRQEQE